MSRTRRSLLAAVSLTLAASMTSACGGILGGGGDDSASGKTLEFWMYQPTLPQQSEAIQKLKEGFEKENNVKVKIVEVPKDDYNTKLASALSSGGGPDAGYLDQPLVASYALDGSVQKVPAGTIDETAYFAGALETNRVGGDLYGVPIAHTTVALFYNKKFVKTPPKTWDELLATSEAVHKAHPDVAGVNVPKGDGYGAWIIPAFVGSAGGTMADTEAKKVTFDDQPAVEAVTLWTDLLKSSPRKITDTADSFGHERAAMTFTGPWDVAAFKDKFPDLDFGVAPLPVKNTPAGNIGGENSVVFKGAKDSELAWKWLEYLTDTEHNGALANALSGFPANQKAADKAALSADPSYRVFVEQLAVAQARPAVPEWIQINDDFVAVALDEAFRGKATPQAALTEGADKARALLKWSK
ncbi:sugar ABC transporter substrate-binding protein [Streptomyces formicae]|uniref:ABC transporter substrate-binding protein n=1 Tax=Streptomyces formicae TaxID=1616117 RepID=A0ABY3WHT0_9ACTN|nr:ABC transporter substrate-binding protein [Streptomyces formicae]UNM12151.1 ABC transporter substrate-binding protein [Streptomyces formicae]